MTIRAMTMDDRAEWLRMRRALWPECSDERHALEIEQFDVAGGVVLFAQRDDASLCGFVEVSIRHDHVDGAASAPVAYVEGWYVDAESRGRGVGRELLAGAEGWAREHGLREIASDAELENIQSIRAHFACGFRETCRAVHFIKQLT